jgi:hypothetical protein
MVVDAREIPVPANTRNNDPDLNNKYVKPVDRDKEPLGCGPLTIRYRIDLKIGDAVEGHYRSFSMLSDRNIDPKALPDRGGLIKRLNQEYR